LEGINAPIVQTAHFTFMDGFHGQELELSHRQKTIYVKGGRVNHPQSTETQSQALTAVASLIEAIISRLRWNFLWRS
jgi:hypothetical protein